MNLSSMQKQVTYALEIIDARDEKTTGKPPRLDESNYNDGLPNRNKQAQQYKDLSTQLFKIDMTAPGTMMVSDDTFEDMLTWNRFRREEMNEDVIYHGALAMLKRHHLLITDMDSEGLYYDKIDPRARKIAAGTTVHTSTLFTDETEEDLASRGL